MTTTSAKRIDDSEDATPRDPLGAFMNYPDQKIEPAATGALTGLRFAVMDSFDVKGYPTGCGHPDILSDAPIAEEHAPAVAELLDAGAEFAGKTLTDELAFDLNGKNPHYGTPLNSRAPERIPGGSSSGSAAATAAGVVDFALGMDSAGAVRAPASYCGVFGMRPSHGKVSIEGCMPLAPTFDTVGWVAGNTDTFAKVGDVLLREDRASLTIMPPTILTDTLELMDRDLREVFLNACKKIGDVFGQAGSVTLDQSGLDYWRRVLRVCQGKEVWSVHGNWIERDLPQFGPGVRDRFDWAARVQTGEATAARETRTGLNARIYAILAQYQVLILPTVPNIAPLKTATLEELDAVRTRAMATLCISSISAGPQITLPLASHQGAPFGISIISAKGTDRALLEFAVKIANAVGVAT